MDHKARILEAARRLAASKPLAEISLADVAREAGVSWPTVRRHLSSMEHLHALLAAEQPALAADNPDTRSRILAAASQVFAEQGLERASLDAVAAAAGLTKGAVYWHFSSKQDLFAALLAEQVHRQLAHAGEQAAALAAATDPETGLANLLATVFQHCTTSPHWPRLFLEFVSLSRDATLSRPLADFLLAGRAATATLARGLQQAGVIAGDLDPTAIAVLLDAIFNGMLVAWVIDPEQFDSKPWARSFARILWRGAAPR